MKYPLTPEYIKNAPKVLEGYYRQLEIDVLTDICSRFVLSGATATALEEIRNLQRRGYSYAYIKAKIKKTAKLTEAQYDKLIQEAIEEARKYYGAQISDRAILYDVFNSEDMTREVDAIVGACKGQLDNITNSLGFSMLMIDGTRRFLKVAEAYQHILSRAEVAVWSGAESYNEVIRRSVKELADSGLRVISWADEERGIYHTDHADVAVRRAVVTSVGQISGAYSESIAKAVPTEYYEITAHIGARTKTRRGRPWTNHKAWQGRVYSTQPNDPDYPSIFAVCGLGQVDGLEGANCRHIRYPFWPGISERTYTDEELANIDPPPFEFRGQTYDAYTASQYQRALEREIRKYRRELAGFNAAEADDAVRETATKLRRIEQEYLEFCDAGNLRPDDDRKYVAEYGPRDEYNIDKLLSS